MSQLELLVLDDHAIVRQGVRMLVQQLPEVMRCRDAANLAEATRLLEQAPADVAVVDLSLKGQSGLSAITALLARWPTLRIVVLTMHADRIHCQRALARGAKGFVAKEDANDELCQAILCAARGVTFLSSTLKSARLSGALGSDVRNVEGLAAATSQLTARERQVLEQIGVGRSMAEISAELGRSVKTIEAHRNNLRAKLGLRNNQQLLQFSAKWMQFDQLD